MLCLLKVWIMKRINYEYPFCITMTVQNAVGQKAFLQRGSAMQYHDVLLGHLNLAKVFSEKHKHVSTIEIILPHWQDKSS